MKKTLIEIYCPLIKDTCGRVALPGHCGTGQTFSEPCTNAINALRQIVVRKQPKEPTKLEYTPANSNPYEVLLFVNEELTGSVYGGRLRNFKKDKRTKK